MGPFQDVIPTLAAGLPQSLDFKVFRASRFAEDPWVQLDRAVFLGGLDWRACLPAPSFDERAREALLVFRSIVAAHEVGSADELRMKKILGWFASVAAAQTTGVVPAGGAEARRLLTEHRVDLGTDIERILAEIESSTGEAGSLAVRGEVRQVQAKIVTILRDRLTQGRLGPRSAAIVEQLLTESPA